VLQSHLPFLAVHFCPPLSNALNQPLEIFIRTGVSPKKKEKKLV